MSKKIITIEEVYERRHKKIQTGEQYLTPARVISFTRVAPKLLEKMVSDLTKYITQQKQIRPRDEIIFGCLDEIERIVILYRTFKDFPSFEIDPLTERRIQSLESFYSGN